MGGVVLFGDALDDRHVSLAYHDDSAAAIVLELTTGIYYLMDAADPDHSCPIGKNSGDLLDYLWIHHTAPPRMARVPITRDHSARFSLVLLDERRKGLPGHIGHPTGSNTRTSTSSSCPNARSRSGFTSVQARPPRPAPRAGTARERMAWLFTTSTSATSPFST